MHFAQSEDELSPDVGTVSKTSGSAAPSGVVAGEWECSDPDLYEIASRPWEILVTPLDRGRFCNRKRYLVTPSLILYRETFSGRILVQGMTPPGMLALNLPIRLGGSSTYWNRPHDGRGLPAAMPGALEARMDAGQDHLILLLSQDLLKRVLGAESASELASAAKSRRLPIPPAPARCLERMLSKLLGRSQRELAVLEEGRALRTLEETLVNWLAAVCLYSPADGPRPCPTRRRVALDRALEYLRVVGAADVTVTGLCRAAAVSRRTLEYAFRDAFGRSPLAFLRMQRLHSARHALRTTAHADARVADIAHQQGLFELSRFAADYRRMFGELPSKTLDRPPESVGRPLIL